MFISGSNKPPRRNSVTDSTDSTNSANIQQPQQKPASRTTDAVGTDMLLYGHNTYGRSAKWKDSPHEPVKGGITPARAVSSTVVTTKPEMPKTTVDWMTYSRDVAESM